MNKILVLDSTLSYRCRLFGKERHFKIKISPGSIALYLAVTCITLTSIGAACLWGGLQYKFQSQELALEEGVNGLERVTSEVNAYKSDLELRTSALKSIIKETLQLDPEDLVESQSIQDSQDAIGGSDAELFISHSDADRLDVLVGSSSGILSEAAEMERLLKSIPIGAPVEGRISSNWGPRKHPRTRRWHRHSGIDIAVDRKAPVLASADGTVIVAGRKGAYGKTVVLDHGNGIQTLYGHLNKVSVKPGAEVCRGQKIGFLGSTGRSTGPHVHYEVRYNGKPRNPKPFIELSKTLDLVY